MVLEKMPKNLSLPLNNTFDGVVRRDYREVRMEALCQIGKTTDGRTIVVSSTSSDSDNNRSFSLAPKEYTVLKQLGLWGSTTTGVICG